VKYHRRLPEMLIKQWDLLRGDRPFPSEDEFSPEIIDDMGFWENCFLTQAHDIKRGKDYNYTYIGSNILEAYQGDLLGVSVHSVASPSADNLTLRYQQVMATQTPLTSEGEFLNARNMNVRYRQCLVPLGKNGKVDTVMGAIRYMLYPDG